MNASDDLKIKEKKKLCYSIQSNLGTWVLSNGSRLSHNIDEKKEKIS